MRHIVDHTVFMPTIKSIELPFGQGTAKCTLEVPDVSEVLPKQEEVISLTYDVVVWLVKNAAEMAILRDVTTALESAEGAFDPRQVVVSFSEPRLCDI